MPELLESTITEHLVNALEQMAFISALPPEQPPGPPVNPLLVRIGFRGPVCRRIEMLTDESLGVAIAANMLGPDSAEVPFRARDALRELLNVTCGAFLAQCPLLPGQRFEMSIPEVQPLDQAAWSQMLAEGDFQVLDAEGQVLAIRLADRK